jgi:hypothetical protein
MAARKIAVRLSEEWRTRIKSARIVERLQRHSLGEEEMTQTQIKAAEILLRKCIPDLASVQHSGEVSHRTAREMTVDELRHIAAGSSTGTASEDGSAAESAVVH